jgi:signal transduction histidine kinase
LEVVVEYSGIGIGEADLFHIFDRFYRAEKSGSTMGNGLGLSLARAFVLVHGGTISADSRIGSGPRFVIKLPRQPHA